MSARIVTYHSLNADPGKEWAAYIDSASGYLPVRFHGRTEDEASSAAWAEWDKHEVERLENLARREAGRIKAAETKARKAAPNGVGGRA